MKLLNKILKNTNKKYFHFLNRNTKPLRIKINVYLHRN